MLVGVGIGMGFERWTVWGSVALLLSALPVLVMGLISAARANDSEIQTPLEFRPYGAEG